MNVQCSIALIIALTIPIQARTTHQKRVHKQRLLITKPGTYAIKKPLRSLTNDTGVITITTSNVTLHLNNTIHYAGKRPNIHGVVVKPGCTNVTIIGNNSAITGFTGSGILMQGTAQQPITNCTINNVTSTHNGTGLTLQHTQATITNCAASHNRNGFTLYNCTSTTLQACNALANRSSRTSYGFLCKKCTGTTILNCTSNGQQADNAIGFAALQGIHNSFISCTAADNSGIKNGVGFLLDNNEQHSVIEKCKAVHNTGNFGYGIQLGGIETTCSTCIVQNNWVAVNCGKQRCYGIKDFSENSSALLLANRAFGHGTAVVAGNTDTGFMNYRVQYADGGRTPRGLIFETDSSMLKTMDTAGPADNISLNGVEN